MPRGDETTCSTCGGNGQLGPDPRGIYHPCRPCGGKGTVPA